LQKNSLLATLLAILATPTYGGGKGKEKFVFIFFLFITFVCSMFRICSYWTGPWFLSRAVGIFFHCARILNRFWWNL